MEHGPRLRKHVDALVGAGLWEAVDGGWKIHDYLDYNPSHAQQEADRAASRKRQAMFRERRRNGVTNGDVTRESQHPVPTRPDPSRP